MKKRRTEDAILHLAVGEGEVITVLLQVRTDFLQQTQTFCGRCCGPFLGIQLVDSFGSIHGDFSIVQIGPPGQVERVLAGVMFTSHYRKQATTTLWQSAPILMREMPAQELSRGCYRLAQRAVIVARFDGVKRTTALYSERRLNEQ